MGNESNAEVKLTPGQKIAGQVVNVLDTQHPEINWPFDTIAALIDQGIDAEPDQEPHPAARLKLGIANGDNPSDQIILEIKGSNNWVQETSVCLHGLLDSLYADAPFEIANLGEAHQELCEAFAAAERGESFTGSIIRTKTLTDQSRFQYREAGGKRIEVTPGGWGAPLLGPCCACEGTEQVVNILALTKLSPMPGQGWGCLACGQPMNGAIAVTCEKCGPNSVSEEFPALKFACKGWPGIDGRVPYESLEGTFDHDMSKHPEVAAAGVNL